MGMIILNLFVMLWYALLTCKSFQICHNKSGEINPIKIQHLVEAYVKKFRYAKKKAAGAIPPPAAQNKSKP
jgi:hypothetical protein